MSTLVFASLRYTGVCTWEKACLRLWGDDAVEWLRAIANDSLEEDEDGCIDDIDDDNYRTVMTTMMTKMRICHCGDEDDNQNVRLVIWLFSGPDQIQSLRISVQSGRWSYLSATPGCWVLWYYFWGCWTHTHTHTMSLSFTHTYTQCYLNVFTPLSWDAKLGRGCHIGCSLEVLENSFSHSRIIQ